MQMFKFTIQGRTLLVWQVTQKQAEWRFREYLTRHPSLPEFDYWSMEILGKVGDGIWSL